MHELLAFWDISKEDSSTGTWNRIPGAITDHRFLRSNQTKGRVRLPNPMNFRKNSKRPLTSPPPSFLKLQDDSKNVSLKIGSRVPKKLGPFFSLFFMRKQLSNGQKWFLRPHFPLIRGMFLLRSGLRFSFRALEVLELGVRKRPF